MTLHRRFPGDTATTEERATWPIIRRSAWAQRILHTHPDPTLWYWRYDPWTT